VDSPAGPAWLNSGPVPKLLARTVVLSALLLAAAACGYDTSTTFNADGTVNVGLKFLFPKSLMQSSSGTAIQGLSPTDIAAANKSLQSKYPGAKIALVAEGDESGALVTVPFKTEKDAFAFLTQPSKLSPSSVTSGTSPAINLSNTGGIFSSATHTTSGANDTYTFKTTPTPLPSPSPGSQQVITDDEVASIFTITFTLKLPHVITSAPGALFTLDRQTAIWKLSWTKPQTLTATTGSEVALAANVGGATAPDYRLVIAVGFTAIAVGFLIGMFAPWRSQRRQAMTPAAAGPMPMQMQAPAPVQAPYATAPVGAPPLPDLPVAWPTPPNDLPPPTRPTS
jgi:hypothetical protein